MHLQLGVTVTAVLEADALKVVVAVLESHVTEHQMTPDVAGKLVGGAVHHAVDPGVAAHAVVGVEAEVVRGDIAEARKVHDRVEADVPGIQW